VDGREIADGKVVSALFARATGMEQKMTRVFCHNGQPVMANYTVDLPPDVRACMFWLRNRRPEQWRENRPLAKADSGWSFEELEEASRRAARAHAGTAAAAAPDTDEESPALRAAAERLDVHP
jgi:hypothetical protein